MIEDLGLFVGPVYEEGYGMADCYELEDGSYCLFISYDVTSPGVYAIWIFSLDLYQYYDIYTDYEFYYEFEPV